MVSVQKLSDPNEEPLFDKRVLKYQSENLTNLIALNQRPSEKMNNWKEVVRKRIEAKTKIKKKVKFFKIFKKISDFNTGLIL